MILSRRTVLLGLGAGALAGCGGGLGSTGGASRTVWRAQPNPAFDAWVAGFRGRAAAAGVSAGTLDRSLRGVGYLPQVIERDRSQTEFTRTLEDYLAIAASDSRVSNGQAKLRSQAATLAAIESRYGVSPRIVTAIWGLESRYGERMGDAPVLSALATLAFDGRRGSFFEQQLVAALKIVDDGDITPERMTGSWAGAMGHTQFIPTSFRSFAVDFNGDGRRDIWSADPTDALASAAAYLNRNGWQRGQPWGVEVALPGGYSGPEGRNSRRTVGAWQAAGVRAAGGGAIPNAGSAALIAPAGAGGPAFLVFRNFNVLLTYNNAVNYAVGVGHLSDRLAGGPAVRGRFPPDRYGLTLEDRKALQTGLNRAGYNVGEADGVLGSRTEDAIRAYQRANGLPVTGTPSPDLLRRLS